MIVSGVYALTIQNTSAAINTGEVDIKIKFYKLNNLNEEVEYENFVLLPGDVTSFVPKVLNLGADCYLRIKIDYINSDVNFEDYVVNFSDDFEKHGEYYYYKNVLKSGENVKIFDAIMVPENIESMIDDHSFVFNVTAEAVQEKNYTPNYTLDNPWEGITPEKNENSSHTIDVGDPDTIKIKYENKADKDITIPDEFLDELKVALPGDEFKDNIEIKNNNKGKANYYVQLETDDNSDIEKELLDRIALIITNKENEVVYEGNLSEAEIIKLAAIESNEEDELEFKISVPSDLANKYTRLNPKLTLVFSHDYKEETEPGDEPGTNPTTDPTVPPSGGEGNGGGAPSGGQPSSGGGSGQTAAKKTNKRFSISSIILPRTGDKIDITITIFIIAAIGLVTTMVLDYRERAKEDIDGSDKK